MKPVKFVTGPGMLYEALQVYHSVYPDLDGITILDPSLIYPISCTNPKFGGALFHPHHRYALDLPQSRHRTVCCLSGASGLVASYSRQSPQEAVNRCFWCGLQ